MCTGKAGEYATECCLSKFCMGVSCHGTRRLTCPPGILKTRGRAGHYGIPRSAFRLLASGSLGADSVGKPCKNIVAELCGIPRSAFWHSALPLEKADWAQVRVAPKNYTDRQPSIGKAVVYNPPRVFGASFVIIFIQCGAFPNQHMYRNWDAVAYLF